MYSIIEISINIINHFRVFYQKILILNIFYYQHIIIDIILSHLSNKIINFLKNILTRFFFLLLLKFFINKP